MLLPEATLKCPNCGSYEHTLFPVLYGEHAGSYVCSVCESELRKIYNKSKADATWKKQLDKVEQCPQRQDSLTEN